MLSVSFSPGRGLASNSKPKHKHNRFSRSLCATKKFPDSLQVLARTGDGLNEWLKLRNARPCPRVVVGQRCCSTATAAAPSCSNRRSGFPMKLSSSWTSIRRTRPVGRNRRRNGRRVM
uniref:(northern house mosquito) hypothetical protein n=2 Tax=Culex pipiens TaxID=7175 RepID=A0A8D8PFS7_CULPI